MSSVGPNTGAVLDLDGMQLRLRWDFGAVASLEKLTGAPLRPDFEIGAQHLLFMLYAAVQADARKRRTEMPIDMDGLGGLLDSQEKVDRAMAAVNDVILDFHGQDTRTPAESGKAQAPETQTETPATGSPTHTNSAPSTSASPKTSSGDSRSVSSSSDAPAGAS